MKKLLLVAMTLWLLAGCAAPEPLTRTVFAMDTWITLSLYDTTDGALLEEAFDRVEEMEALWSRTRAGSDVARICEAAGEPVAVAAETYALLEDALAWCAASEGALDITVAPVSALWDFTGGTEPPAAEDIAAALPRVGCGQVTLEAGRVSLPEGAALDLGAVAKGAAADRLAAWLREAGVRSALLDLGGNIYALGRQPSGRPWRVGIRDPADPGSLLMAVEAEDLSVVTSWVYQRNFISGGRLYHHILDPETGYPADRGLLAVTVFSRSSLDGDALSTACMVLGEARGMALIEETEGVEAVFVREDGSLALSSGMGSTIPYELR